MSPSLLRLTCLLVFLTSATSGFAAKQKRAGRRAALVPPVEVPAAPQPTPPPTPAAPPNFWRTWGDPQGRKIEAEFLGLTGETMQVRTRDGRLYSLNLSKLLPADQTAARQMQQILPPPPVDISKAAAKVDELVLAGLTKAGQKPNPPASDEQWVRRLYLDVAGRIPTATETLAFTTDKTPNKRAKLIDQLLNSEGYNSQMFDWLADMLRVIDDYGKGTKTYVYEEWMKEQIAKNRPWNGLVHDLMAADGRISSTGAVGYLLRDRGMPLDSLSNTLTTFLGANVACAQCHNHPIADWTQRDFYQMAAFFGATDTGTAKINGRVKKLAASSGMDRSILASIMAPNSAAIEDLRTNKLTYPSDYKYSDAKSGQTVTPKLISWTSLDANNPAYRFNPGSPETLRDQFADWLTHSENPRFATAIANRLWKKYFGLAVQEPLGDLDDLTKGSNPELLAYLTTQMKLVKFDLRAFQRILLNTQAYQRSASMTPDLNKGPYLFPGPLLRRMTAEQAWDSVLALVIGPALDDFKLDRSAKIRAVDIPGALTNAAVLAKVKALQQDGSAKDIRQNGGKKGGNSNPRPEDYEGNPPPRFEGMIMARASELQQPAKESHFLRMFGQSDRQLADNNSLEGGVPQVLMMMNGEVQKVIASRASVVLTHAAKEPTPGKQIEALYLSFLGRRPTLNESSTAQRSLQNGLQLSDLTWVLFNSREFIFIQ